MAISKNRVKVVGVGGDIVSPFSLGTPVEGFVSFPEGSVRYIVLSDTGDWQIGLGIVTGTSLTRGTVEENHLGTTAQIDFSAANIQIAQVTSVAVMNAITNKLDGIETNATADQVASEVVSSAVGIITSENVQSVIEEISNALEALAAADTAVSTSIAKATKYMGATAPVDPVDGQEWLNTDTMKEYTWYVGTLTNQWVRNP